LTILPTTGTTRALVQERAFLALLVLAAIILIAVVVAGAIGPHTAGPTFEILPDPAGPLPF